jgi:hypothetical protein
VDADPNPNFHVDAYPDPDPDLDSADWHQNEADPHADPTPSFTHAGKSEYFFVTFSHSIASLLCFIFLISVKCAIILNFLDRI